MMYVGAYACTYVCVMRACMHLCVSSRDPQDDVRLLSEMYVSRRGESINLFYKNRSHVFSASSVENFEEIRKKLMDYVPETETTDVHDIIESITLSRSGTSSSSVAADERVTAELFFASGTCFVSRTLPAFARPPCRDSWTACSLCTGVRLYIDDDEFVAQLLEAVGVPVPTAAISDAMHASIGRALVGKDIHLQSTKWLGRKTYKFLGISDHDGEPSSGSEGLC